MPEVVRDLLYAVAIAAGRRVKDKYGFDRWVATSLIQGYLIGDKRRRLLVTEHLMALNEVVSETIKFLSTLNPSQSETEAKSG
jgi:hypothetical protein